MNFGTKKYSAEFPIWVTENQLFILSHLGHKKNSLGYPHLLNLLV